MPSDAREELPKIAQLVELTSDAVAVCGHDGTIGHVNRRFCELAGKNRRALEGADIKDLLFSDAFERAADHRLPFPLSGDPVALRLKLADGSFIPVEVRATAPSARSGDLRNKIVRRLQPRERVLVVVRSLAEQVARDRQMRRVLSELQAANKRLSGTLSVIMATVGAEDLTGLLDSVLNKLVDALDADGSTMYFAENGGFKLRGVSQGLVRSYVPEFIPFGAGVPTYVFRAARACRISVVPADEGIAASGVFYDLDKRVTRQLRVQDTPPFKTLIAVPVFFGRQIMGVMELGWRRPCMPRTYDVNVLEVICDYLSIELVSLITSLRSRRSAELTRSLNNVRDTVFTLEGDRNTAWAEVSAEVRRVLGCHICPVRYDPERSCYVLDFEGGSQVVLPGGAEWLDAGGTAPAAQMNAAVADYFDNARCSAEAAGELEGARVTRIDRLSRAGEWLLAHGLPNHGAVIEFGPAEASGDAPAPEAADGALMTRARALALSNLVLILRDNSQEPIADVEYDYLVRLTHEFEMLFRREAQQAEDAHISQALQAGMQSSLGQVPGITSDALYSSATKQALVGGDFYTLIRLPDDRAVMILGDVSGKGVEAASMSALVKTALTAYAWEGASPQHMVRSLNSMLMSFSRVETFATMFVAKLDLRRGSALYCSAGHPPSMLLRRRPLGADSTATEATEIELLSTQSGVVGAFEGMAFRTGSFRFAPGDVLFMYTDGAIEARNAAGEFFGEQRLRDVLLASIGSGVHGLCQRVLDELDSFTDSALEDDIAMVALRFDTGVETVRPPSAAARRAA
ncbi:SpoIIE family protein phosphatase [Collinsella intestinalis]|uniref:SpoIIE family protein phosphatase n=1 Tax=Collinsella intestinalis TaxID=147207 RepID=UPI0025A4993F|nr:SpoIIE family protein phosphatase [Collinsella intestinalis]MDM8163832.1 SpoIIE family protein phosphatase [Collinsella intestinalis]